MPHISEFVQFKEKINNTVNVKSTGYLCGSECLLLVKLCKRMLSLECRHADKDTTFEKKKDTKKCSRQATHIHVLCL
jgi:hypothetical protein